MTSRQAQLAKLTPSQVIELAYLSALLEQHPNNSISVFSRKFEIIAKFLRDVVKVVPFESIAFAIAFSSYETALVCYEALSTCGIEPPVSHIMSDGLVSAGYRMRDGISPQLSIVHHRSSRMLAMMNKLSTRSQFDHENQLVKLETFARGSPFIPIDETTICDCTLLYVTKKSDNT